MRPMSFSGFKSLKHLRVAPIFVYGEVLQLSQADGTRRGLPPSQEGLESTKMVMINALPTQLEILGLILCNRPSTLDRIVVSLRELLVSESLKNLREVVIRGTEPEMLKGKLAILIALPWRGVHLVVKNWGKPVYSKEGYYESRLWGWDEEVKWGGDLLYSDKKLPLEAVYDSERAE